MAGKTVTRADLCEAVYQKVGLSRTESATLVEMVLKEITDSLERGETVKLSSFGSFVVRKKGQRIGRNPKTGKEVPISPRRPQAKDQYRAGWQTSVDVFRRVVTIGTTNRKNQNEPEDESSAIDRVDVVRGRR
jgi:integration host factor subunit alpha